MKKQTNRVTKLNLNISSETRATIAISKAVKSANEAKPNISIKGMLSSVMTGGRSIIPKPEYDSVEMEAGRVQFDTYADWLEKHPSVYEKAYLRVIKQLAVTKGEEVIMQSCIIRYIDGLSDAQAQIASAQALYNLSVAGVLTMSLVEGADKTKYHKIGLGTKLPDVSMEARRIQRKTAKHAARLVSNIMSEKVARNNRDGLYKFEKDSSPYATQAAIKLQSQKMRLFIPKGESHIEIATNIFKLDPIDTYGNVNHLYYELLQELKDNNGKTYYVEKTLDRALRIYGFKWTDITAPSAFRPYLRLSRKVRITVAGLEAYREHLEEERSNLPEWFIAELEALNVGDYTNIMVEVDANNQGPAIIAAAMRDKFWFNKYWGSEDAPKMYQVFLENLMDNLELPHDTLVVKDVKYKIMTKAYNKEDKSNVFGDKKFLVKLEAEFLPGFFLEKQEFHNLPLKIQLQKRLGDSYSIEDSTLLSAYAKALHDTAPFLAAFAQAVKILQDGLKFKPSIFEWMNTNGDKVMSARSITNESNISYYGVSGFKHTIKYMHKDLVEVNKRGGETALSPTWVASEDAVMAHGLIVDADYELFSNHDAFFPHGNNKRDIQDRYVPLFLKIPDNADAWFLGLQDKYLFNGPRMTLSEMVGNTGDKRLTDEDILNAQNLIG